METHEKKRPMMKVKVEDDDKARKWDEMDHHILVLIMECLARRKTPPKAAAVTCKSWMEAFLSLIFPPGHVLDLSDFDNIPHQLRRVKAHYLKIVLNRPHEYTKLILPLLHFKGEAYDYIAQRLPALKCIVLPRLYLHSYNKHVIRCWPELEEAHIQASFLVDLSTHCKNIRKLNLWGRIGDDRAAVIADNFPRLVHLEIRHCCLSPNALSIILDGHKNLLHLNTQHAFCITDLSYSGSLYAKKSIEWDEDKIQQKLKGIGEYVGCGRMKCSFCFAHLSTFSEVVGEDARSLTQDLGTES